jgi:hypothetical protein
MREKRMLNKFPGFPPDRWRMFMQRSYMNLQSGVSAKFSKYF